MTSKKKAVDTPALKSVHIAKLGFDIEVDYDNFPEKSKEFIIDYGLKQLINDSHSGINKEDVEAIQTAIQNKVAQMEEGLLGVRVISGAKNPVESFYIKALAEMSNNSQKAIKEALSKKEVSIVEYVEAHSAKDKIIAKAEELLEQSKLRATTPEIELDIEL